MSTASKQQSKYQTQETLWCFPYDTDTVFKPFLKVPFSTFINNIISNDYFPQYQAIMAKEICDRNLWNEKCWRIIQFFQFLNNNFEIDKWDNHISFIEDNTLRSTMGFFRLWIDTERLYLLNFLKLDSNQFQEDRIYMSTYRILVFFNNLFSEYMFKDFDIDFLNNFIKNCTSMLQKMQPVATNDTGQIINCIISLLVNIKKREKFLIDPKLLHTLIKSAAIKVGKLSQSITEVENRLMNSVGFKKKVDEQLRLKMICKPGFIQQFTNKIKTLYDPIQKIQEEQGQQFFGTPQQKARRRQQYISDKVEKYKQKVKQPIPTNIVIYEQLEYNHRNPYQIQNFLIYGQAVKINMENKTKYKKTKQVQVVSVEDNDRSKLYYDEDFLKEMENADKYSGKVTVKDLNLSGSKGTKKPINLNGNHDENTKVFNLKWHQDPSSARRKTQHEQNEYGKNYDNNLLFKSPLEDQLLQNSKNSLDKLRKDAGTKTYTIAVLQEQAKQVHPPNNTESFGVDPFIKKIPQILDIRNFKLLNHNKFDFMRKVVGYMTAQKKIKNILADKNVPDQLPRYYSDVKQESYNPIIQTEKVKFAMGKLDHIPQIYL